MTSSSKKRNLGRLALFIATLFWGVSFVMMKSVLDNIPPLFILSIRFSGAALILLPLCIGKKPDKAYLKSGLLLGAALMLAYMFQTYGLRYTTPGKNAFLTSAYCVIVPFLYWILMKRRPNRFNAIAALICFIGIGFISLDSDLHMGLGDTLTLICGFFYALHIVITTRVIKNRDPVMLAMLQFATVGAISIIGALLFEPFPTAVTPADWWSIAFLTVVCTTGCLLMQIFGQKYTPPSQAAVILTLESVFGALASVLLIGEIFTPRLIIGFALTFFAILISETKLEFLRLIFRKT